MSDGLAKRHQIYQVKLTFVPFGGLEFTPNFTSLRKQPTFHDATNGFPRGGGRAPHMKGVGMLVGNFELNP